MSKKLLQYYQTKMNKGGKILPKYQSTGLFTGLIDPRQRAASESTNSGIQNKVAQQIGYQNIANKNAEQKVKQLMEKGNYSEAHARRAVRTNEPQASKIIENITNDDYRIQMHPDYDPRKSLESQNYLLNDNSLRTRVLRGANMFTNTGNTGADFAAGLITAPGRSFANLSLDANKRYFNPNNTGLGNFANFAEDVINVAPSLIPKAAGALAAAENAIGRGSKFLSSSKGFPGIRNVPFNEQSNFNFLNKLSEEEFRDYVSKLTPKQKNILYGLGPVDIDEATRSKLVAALEVGDNPVIGTRGTISEHKNNWYGIDPEDYLPEDIHTANPEAWDYVQKNHLNQGDARNHLLDLFSREGFQNSQNPLARGKTSIFEKLGQKVLGKRLWSGAKQFDAGLNQGLYELIDNKSGRSFGEIFPTSKSQIEAATTKAQKAGDEGAQFVRQWVYDKNGNIRSEVKEKIEDMFHGEGTPLSSKFYRPNYSTVNGPMLDFNNNPTIENPFNTTPDVTVSSRKSGLMGHPDIPNWLGKHLVNTRHTMAGVNTADYYGNVSPSISFMNSGAYYYNPSYVAETAAHEGGHTFQKLGANLYQFDQVPDLNRPGFTKTIPVVRRKSFGDLLAEHDPTYGYYVANKNTKIGKEFAEAMNEPVVGKDNWATSPNELHSELMPARKKLVDAYVKEHNLNPEQAMEYVRNPTDEQIDWMIKTQNLNRFFKKDVTDEVKRKLIRYLPAVTGVGAVATSASAINNKQKEGGITDAGYKLGLDLIEHDNQLKEGGSLPLYQQRGQVSSIEYTTQNSSNNKGNQFSDYSRIINSYPNRPNDTTYTYNSQLPNNNVESFYYNTGQNNKGGIPTGQLQNNRSFLNPNQEQVSSYLKLINDKFKYKKGGPIVDPRGQWAHPGQVTRIPSSKITMQDVPYPVYGVGSNGKKQMMYPNQEYDFGNAEHVDEFPMMQGGGLWNTNKRAWVDSIHNARRGDLNFVKRYFDPSAGSIQIPGEQGTSTHFMEWGDKRAYPTVVQMPNGKLQYLNQNDKNAAWNYAKRTGQFIQFPNDEQAEWYANNGYKQGTNVLKYQVGGEKEPEPYFKTAEDRENYRKKLKQVSETALNNNISDEDLLLNTSYHNIESGNNCINGICGLNIAAGLNYNKPTDKNRFLSGEKFAVAVGQGDEDYYQVNGNFQIGDHLQYRYADPKDWRSHNKIIYDVTTDKGGDKIYKVIDNGGGKDMKSRDYTEAELKEALEKGAGGYDKVNVYRPGYALDKPLLEKERENTVAGKAVRDRANRVAWEKSHNPGYKYSIRKDSPYYEDQPKGMQKFIAFANDDSKINDLVKKLGVDKETIHDELLNTFGELGQENKWKDPIVGGNLAPEFLRKIGLKIPFENTIEKGLTAVGGGKGWSVGPGQIKYKNIDPKLKKIFNINSPKDLYDFDKIIPLMTAMNIQNRKWMENKGEDLSNYLIGKPGVDASQLDGGVGRWTPYMYPGKLNNPVNIANKEISGTDLYGKELTNERNRLIRKNARLFDEGSYAGQVFNKIDQNLERTLPGEYFDIPQDMQPIVIKGKPKQKEGGSLNRTVTCSNCGHSWKLSDGGKDPVTCHNCGGQIKMKYGGKIK